MMVNKEGNVLLAISMLLFAIAIDNFRVEIMLSVFTLIFGIVMTYFYEKLAYLNVVDKQLEKHYDIILEYYDYIDLMQTEAAIAELESLLANENTPKEHEVALLLMLRFSKKRYLNYLKKK